MLLGASLLIGGGGFLTPRLDPSTLAQQKKQNRQPPKSKDRQLVRPKADGSSTSQPPASSSRVAANTTTANANQRRLALVIGNGAYRQPLDLNNPVNDARLISATLGELGFTVLVHENLARPEMLEAVQSFGQRLGNGGIGLFYYAGHGVQVNGRNYLVPLNYGRVNSLEDAERELLNAEDVLKTMASKQGLNIVILDACRNNPTELEFTVEDKPGFAEIKNTPAGTFIAYSTSPGHGASDGEGDHSPYSSALAQSLRLRPSRLEDVFIHTRIQMDKSTDGRQVPWENSSIKTIFFFRPDVLTATPLPNLTFPGPLRSQLLKGLLGGLRPHAYVVPQTSATGRVTTQLNGRAKYFVEEHGGMEMVEIPGARFLMGSNAADADAAYDDAKRYNDEISRATVTAEMPQHAVDMPGFYMSKHEITQRQWAAVMGSAPRLEAKYQGAEMPVVNVSWRDAEEFCARLSRLTGRLYRLPSEAEWEYAARAGTATPFAYGPTINPQLSNYNGTQPYGQGAGGKYLQTLSPVGQTGAANAFGLYDMHGNAWEWCADNWHDSYDGAPTDGSVWEEADEDNRVYRVIRGGSWDSTANSCRSASRRSAATTTATKKIGFRVVVS